MRISLTYYGTYTLVYKCIMCVWHCDVIDYLMYRYTKAIKCEVRKLTDIYTHLCSEWKMLTIKNSLRNFFCDLCFYLSVLSLNVKCYIKVWRKRKERYTRILLYIYINVYTHIIYIIYYPEFSVRYVIFFPRQQERTFFVRTKLANLFTPIFHS